MYQISRERYVVLGIALCADNLQDLEVVGHEWSALGGQPIVGICPSRLKDRACISRCRSYPMTDIPASEFINSKKLQVRVLTYPLSPVDQWTQICLLWNEWKRTTADCNWLELYY